MDIRFEYNVENDVQSEDGIYSYIIFVLDGKFVFSTEEYECVCGSIQSLQNTGDTMTLEADRNSLEFEYEGNSLKIQRTDIGVFITQLGYFDKVERRLGECEWPQWVKAVNDLKNSIASIG